RLSFDHRSFAVLGLLALLGFASHPVLVHRPTLSFPASSPQSVALLQLRFTSIRMVSSRRDLHPLDSAHAGRTQKQEGVPLALLLACLVRSESQFWKSLT